VGVFCEYSVLIVGKGAVVGAEDEVLQ